MGDGYETDCACDRGDGCAFGLRDHTTADANLPGWLASCSGTTMSAASATTASASNGLPGRNDGPGRHGMPGSAATAASAALADARGRTRLTMEGRHARP